MLLEVPPQLLGCCILNLIPQRDADLPPILRHPLHAPPLPLGLLFVLLADRLHASPSQLSQPRLQLRLLLHHLFQTGLEFRQWNLNSTLPQGGTQLLLFRLESDRLVTKALNLAVLLGELLEEVFGLFFLICVSVVVRQL